MKIEITPENIDEMVERLSDIEQGFVEAKDGEYFELNLAIQNYLDLDFRQ